MFYFSGEVAGAFLGTLGIPPNTQKLKKFYKLFELEESTTDIIGNPYNVSNEVIDKKILGDDLKDKCLNDLSLAKYVYDNMQESPSLIALKEAQGEKAFDNFFKLFTFIRQLQAFNTLSSTNYVIGNLDDEDPSQTRSFSGNDRREIVGGVEVLSEKIYEELQKLYGKTGSKTFRIIGGNRNVKAEVKTIKETDDGYLNVEYLFTINRARPRMKKTKGHYVIFTPTSKIATQVNFEPPLSVNKLNALKNIHYSSSLKIFLAFSEAFWENPGPESMIPSIPFRKDVNDPEAVLGAASFADDFLIQVSLWLNVSTFAFQTGFIKTFY